MSYILCYIDAIVKKWQIFFAFASPKWHIIVAIYMSIWYNMIMEAMP